MKKIFLASFFTLVFAFLITAPTVISVLEDSYDVSVFFGINEEENNEKDSNKTLELIVLETKNVDSLFFSEEKKNISYFFKNYPKPHLNLIFPPPEQPYL